MSRFFNISLQGPGIRGQGNSLASARAFSEKMAEMTGRAEIGSMGDFGNAHIAVVQTVSSMAQFFSANTAIHLFKQLVQFGAIHCRHRRQLGE